MLARLAHRGEKPRRLALVDNPSERPAVHAHPATELPLPERRAKSSRNSHNPAAPTPDLLPSPSGRGAGGEGALVPGEPTPNLDHPLLKRPNVIVTPHVAFYSTDARLELGARIAQDVVRFLHGGRPEYVVTE